MFSLRDGIYIVIILILVFYLTYDDDFKTGFWIGDDDFCEESEVSTFMLYLGPAEHCGLTTTRAGYLIIDDIINDSFSMHYSRLYGSKATLQFDESDVWPEQVILHVDARQGRMTIKTADTVYARLTKDYSLSNYAQI